MDTYFLHFILIYTIFYLEKKSDKYFANKILIAFITISKTEIFIFIYFCEITGFLNEILTEKQWKKCLCNSQDFFSKKMHFTVYVIEKHTPKKIRKSIDKLQKTATC